MSHDHTSKSVPASHLRPPHHEGNQRRGILWSLLEDCALHGIMEEQVPPQQVKKSVPHPHPTPAPHHGLCGPFVTHEPSASSPFITCAMKLSPGPVGSTVGQRLCGKPPHPPHLVPSFALAFAHIPLFLPSMLFLALHAQGRSCCLSLCRWLAWAPLLDFPAEQLYLCSSSSLGPRFPQL